MNYKTGMTVVDHLPLPNKVTDVFVPPLSAIPKSTTYSGSLSSPLLSHSTMSYDKSTIAKSHKSTAAPDPASMNSSEDTPNLHTWKRTSTTDASEHESSSPMKKKIKRVYSSYEETPSHEGYWTNEEHSQFEKGIILYGWGNWKRVESCIPTRNKVQIKTHAQKFSRCRPSQKERLVSMYEENAHSLQLSKNLQRKPDLSKARPLPLTKREQQDDSGWSIIEKKQFEDGCVFHGWGSWYDIAAHIITKDIDQVLKYAGSYDRNDIERLRREHTNNIQDDDNALIDQDPKTHTQRLKSPPKTITKTSDELESSSDDDESEITTKPPPTWLAVENWDTVLANIQRWNNRLTENERSIEYEKYNSLPEKEKDRLRKKLMRLLQSQPYT
jgi:SHAQKYF class myb-like DNA-binding protein